MNVGSVKRRIAAARKLEQTDVCVSIHCVVFKCYSTDTVLCAVLVLYCGYRQRNLPFDFIRYVTIVVQATRLLVYKAELWICTLCAVRNTFISIEYFIYF